MGDPIQASLAITSGGALLFNQHFGRLACAMGMPVELARLPSLDLIRGFVAVGRRMSITLAAQDLFLTQSAVSRQIHALETGLGVRLLVRGHRSIAFTPEGERLFRSADGAVQQLQDVLGEVRPPGMFRPVTISTATGFAGLWLLPRLSRLQQQHPGIDVRVSANNQVVDLRNEGIDLAIRYTTMALAPRGSSLLFGERLGPVAAPGLGLKALKSSTSLARQTLLEFDDPRAPSLRWKAWLHSVGWADAKVGRYLHFNQYDMVIQAALAGQGIALGRHGLIDTLISAQRLVWLAAPKAPGPAQHSYWLVRAEAHQRGEVRDVASWIESESVAGQV